jgi:hypothetical protein
MGFRVPNVEQGEQLGGALPHALGAAAVDEGRLRLDRVDQGPDGGEVRVGAVDDHLLVVVNVVVVCVWWVFEAKSGWGWFDRFVVPRGPFCFYLVALVA